MNGRETYPPLNTLKPVAEDVWIVDGPAIRFGPRWFSMPFPTRMTVIRTGTGLFGSLWSIVIAFVISYMSYGTRALNGAMLQVHKDLEEAAKMSGARTWRVMWRVFCPLLLPALGGVWVWVALHVVRVAGMPLMLSDGSSNEVLSVVIWNMWDQGSVEQASAIGTLMMLTLLALVLGLRLIRFGRYARVTRA